MRRHKSHFIDSIRNFGVFCFKNKDFKFQEMYWMLTQHDLFKLSK